MALRHSDRHLDPHGHSHGPRRDELHGSRVATARPQQNKGTRQFADGCPVSYSFKIKSYIGSYASSFVHKFTKRSLKSFPKPLLQLLDSLYKSFE